MFVRCPQYADTRSFANVNAHLDTHAHCNNHSCLTTNGDAHGHCNRR